MKKPGENPVFLDENHKYLIYTRKKPGFFEIKFEISNLHPEKNPAGSGRTRSDFPKSIRHPELHPEKNRV